MVLTTLNRTVFLVKNEEVLHNMLYLEYLCGGILMLLLKSNGQIS